jgi:formylglycine-generating enzyme required for sulfatase activity
MWIISLLFLPTLVAAQSPARTDCASLKTSIGMTLKRIPAGPFLMRSPPEEVILLDEKLQHRVTISSAFYLGIHEVTQREYKQILGRNPSKFQDSDRLPVEQVSWLDVVTFCNKLSEREGRKAYYSIEGEKVSVLGGNGFRLPTEAE